jgi:hypothetical protein
MCYTCKNESDLGGKFTRISGWWKFNLRIAILGMYPDNLRICLIWIL